MKKVLEINPETFFIFVQPYRNFIDTNVQTFYKELHNVTICMLIIIKMEAFLIYKEWMKHWIKLHLI
jgi:hypothetical protein